MLSTILPVFAPPSAPIKRVPETFALALAPLTAICRPALTEQQVQGYYLALGDLSLDVLALAATKIAATRIYPTYPMPGEIRAAAAEILAGPALPFGDAWALAINVAKRLCRVTDPAYRKIVPGSGGEWVSPHEFNSAIIASLPPAVGRTLERFGELIDDSTCRAQFRRIYEETVEAERQRRLLPRAIVEQIDAIAQRSRPEPAPAAFPDPAAAARNRLNNVLAGILRGRRGAIGVPAA